MIDKRPLAAVASLLIPGTGQHVLGRHSTGPQWMAAVTGLYVVPSVLGLTPTGIAGWLILYAPAVLIHLLCVMDTQRTSGAETN